jgi:hypothetical protein
MRFRDGFETFDALLYQITDFGWIQLHYMRPLVRPGG